MTVHGDADDEFIDELRALVAGDDAPPGVVVEAARAAFGTRRLDAELAELLRDSALEPAGVRGGDAPRLLTFELPGLAVEVEVAVTGTRRRVLGQVVPPRSAAVDVEHGGGVAHVDADELGRFAVGEIVGGPVRLRLSFDDGRRVDTDWVVM